MLDRNRPVHRRTSKACDGCRRRKAKCNGFAPCLTCTQRGERCRYRSVNRVRHSQATQGHTDSLGTGQETTLGPNGYLADHQPSDSYASSRGEETADEVYLSVNTTQKTTRSTIQLYCGPSSNFAFLQQLYKTFAPVNSLSTNASSTIAADQGIDYFRQRRMFFGTRQSFATSKGTQEIEQSPHLPLELAQVFVEKFSGTVLHLAPFLNHKTMEQWLGQLYHEDEEMASDTRALILAILANGATLTEHVKWADTLYERAKNEVHLLEETVNNKAIQASLLLITSSGRPNLAYLELGQACRKAYAAGLHRDVEYSSTQPRSDATSERRTTFWSLLFWERWVSFWLGRPSSITGDSISAPFPSTSMFTLALGELSNIISKSAKYIYEDRRFSLAKLRLSLQSIRHELESFQKRMEPILGFALDGSVDEAKANVQQLFMMNFLSHTCMTSFRPCLIAYNSLKSRKSVSIPFLIQQSPSSPESDLFWLLEACHCAVDSARRLIHYLFESFNRYELLRSLSFTSACIESACLLLVYHAMKNWEMIPPVKKSLEEALHCVSHMTSKEQVDGVIFTIQRMLSKIQETQAFHERNDRMRSSPSQITYFGPYTQPRKESANATRANNDASEPTTILPHPIPFDGSEFNGPSNNEIFDIDFNIFAPNLGDYFTLEESDFLNGDIDDAFLGL